MGHKSRCRLAWTAFDIWDWSTAAVAPESCLLNYMVSYCCMYQNRTVDCFSPSCMRLQMCVCVRERYYERACLYVRANNYTDGQRSPLCIIVSFSVQKKSCLPLLSWFRGKQVIGEYESSRVVINRCYRWKNYDLTAPPCTWPQHTMFVMVAWHRDLLMNSWRQVGPTVPALCDYFVLLART